MITKITLQNLGTANKNRVVISTSRGQFILYFSYETLVGIDYGYKEKQVRAVIENQWSTTTGKLLNEIEPDKTKRVKPAEFNEKVAEMMKFINS